MSIRYDFMNPEGLAEFVVGKSILESMIEEKRKNIIERVNYVMNNCRGAELLVCDILSSSAEEGELERYLEDLEIHQYLKKLKIHRQRPIQYLIPLRRLIIYGV